MKLSEENPFNGKPILSTEEPLTVRSQRKNKRSMAQRRAGKQGELRELEDAIRQEYKAEAVMEEFVIAHVIDEHEKKDKPKDDGKKDKDKKQSK